MQDMSTGPSSNMAGERHARTVVAFHLASVQQVTGYWLLPLRVQEGSGSSTAKEEGTLCQPVEEL